MLRNNQLFAFASNTNSGGSEEVLAIFINLSDATTKFATIESSSGFDISSPAFHFYYSPSDKMVTTLQGFDSTTGDFLRSFLLLDFVNMEIFDSMEWTVTSD